jgi:integrase
VVCELRWRACEAEHNLIRVGARPKPKSAGKPQLLIDVTTEYMTWGRAQGGHGGRPWSPVHASHRKTHLDFWSERLGSIAIQEITMNRVEAVLRDLKAKGRTPKNRKKAVPMTGKSLNAYAESIKALCEWAKDRNYLYENPLDRLKRYNEAPALERRALSVEELRRVFECALRPEDRVLFEVACLTGYRRGELKALRVKDLDEVSCTLPLAAEFCMGRKAARQPVPRALMEKLAESAKGKSANDPLLMVNDKPHERLYFAMERAGIQYKGEGWRIDLHSLRVTYATMLDQVGASPKENQSLMRHSTMQLTYGTYAKAGDKRKQELAEALGEKILSGRAGSVLETKKEALAMVGSTAAVSDCSEKELVSPRGFEPRSSG